MTYSVVMRDAATGRLGVGVQSHWFNVGRIVPWVRPGVGAVATQSIAEPMYGPRGLDLMAEGASASDAMERLLADDDGRDLRQLGFVDSSGRAAAHTGALCIAHAGHAVGEGWAIQANIMRDASVVPAMAEAAASAKGDLAGRIVSVLEAAEAAGGDLRGSQSTAVVVSGIGPVPDLDLRIEDHRDPIGELRRLLTVHRAYEEMNAGDEAAGAGDGKAAAEAYHRAAAMAEGNAEVRFWQAVGLATLGDERAPALYREVVAASPDLDELLTRLPATGLVPAEVVSVLRGD